VLKDHSNEIKPFSVFALATWEMWENSWGFECIWLLLLDGNVVNHESISYVTSDVPGF
jgi:hypothetical protein